MSTSLWHLGAAAVVFVLGHNLPALPPVRERLVAWLSEWPYRLFYSLLAVLTLTWLVLAFAGAPAVPVWQPPTGLRHVSLTLMPIAWIFLVCGYTGPNPTAVGLGMFSRLEGAGILKVTRHPVLWAVVLWGVAHLLATGDAAAMIFFGAITLMTLQGIANIERKKRAEHGVAWEVFAAETSNVPFAGILSGRIGLRFGEIGGWRIAVGIDIHAVVLYFHGWLFGAAPLPNFTF